ncbi:copper homeostasis protein CutC [Rhodobacter sp. Har01]|uniref:copper homeostasis protein CutC n=1 Tax=Rhodobacter sp. Har01 TaxID=2883999 RepID=UPI001D08ED3E|nr:copper homeostasis protein CutC [Rhodobacter sp. Har01]MCB6178145.1 copper homeostasis protein CutC [Rhodobacter sp. Har01]
MGRVTVELCVDTAEGLAAAINGGADRLEVCSALSVGGLTPSVGLMGLAAQAGVPALAMIRPRAGDFVFSPAEVVVMEADIAAARAAGLAGVVLGASLPDGRLDAGLLVRLVTAAQGLDLTLHRCFDLVPDRVEALETAIGLGFARVLTSGGVPRAEDGIVSLAALVQAAQGRIAILAGSGITAANAARLVAAGLTELHASCLVDVAAAGPVAAFGFGPATLRVTDANCVRALVAAVH